MSYPFNTDVSAAIAFHHMFSLPVVMWTQYIKLEIQEKLTKKTIVKQTKDGDKSTKSPRLPFGFNDVMHPYIFSTIFKAQLRLLNLFGPWVNCIPAYGDSLKKSNAFLYYIFNLNSEDPPHAGSSILEAVADLRKSFKIHCRDRNGFQTNMVEIHLYVLSLLRCGLFSVDTSPIRDPKANSEWDFVNKFQFKSKTLNAVGEGAITDAEGKRIKQTVKAFPQPDDLEIKFIVNTEDVFRKALGVTDEAIEESLPTSEFPNSMTLDEVFCFVLFGRYVGNTPSKFKGLSGPNWWMNLAKAHSFFDGMIAQVANPPNVTTGMIQDFQFDKKQNLMKKSFPLGLDKLCLKDSVLNTAGTPTKSKKRVNPSTQSGLSPSRKKQRKQDNNNDHDTVAVQLVQLSKSPIAEKPRMSPVKRINQAIEKGQKNDNATSKDDGKQHDAGEPKSVQEDDIEEDDETTNTSTVNVAPAQLDEHPMTDFDNDDDIQPEVKDGLQPSDVEKLVANYQSGKVDKSVSKGKDNQVQGSGAEVPLDSAEKVQGTLEESVVKPRKTGPKIRKTRRITLPMRTYVKKIQTETIIEEPPEPKKTSEEDVPVAQIIPMDATVRKEVPPMLKRIIPTLGSIKVEDNCVVLANGEGEEQDRFGYDNCDCDLLVAHRSFETFLKQTVVALKDHVQKLSDATKIHALQVGKSIKAETKVGGQRGKLIKEEEEYVKAFVQHQETNVDLVGKFCASSKLIMESSKCEFVNDLIKETQL